MGDYILVIDEGTTSTRAIVFDRDLNEVALAQEEVPLTYPNEGWVEQDGEEIWEKTLGVCRSAIAEAGGAERIAGIGITNQRETTLVWDRATGKPVAPAIIHLPRGRPGGAIGLPRGVSSAGGLPAICGFTIFLQI